MGRQVALLVIAYFKSRPLKTAARGGPPLPPPLDMPMILTHTVGSFFLNVLDITIMILIVSSRSRKS